ncbi:hypothetical protein OG21DRAFT_1525492 [Imleria badia]|nr:hypothetical protein OG21DRAFT_1525492 [Imleria badia]
MSDYRYHWAFLTGPKSDNNGTAGGKRFHAVNKIINRWVFEEVDRPNLETGSLIAQVHIAKIMDMDQLVEIFSNIPVTPEMEGWNLCFLGQRCCGTIANRRHSAGDENG